MSRPPVERLEHTADLRLRFRGATLQQLLGTAARALGEYLCGPAVPGPDREVRLLVGGEDDLARFVAALNEILFLLQARNLRIREAVLKEEPAQWKLTLLAEESAAPPSTEIKAATYHEAVLRREGGEWLAEITFDL